MDYTVTLDAMMTIVMPFIAGVAVGYMLKDLIDGSGDDF